MVRDVKQASFRLNSGDTEKFKEFCETSEMTAAQGFSVLLEVMELDRAGKLLPARKTEIENFEQLTKSIVSAYLHSLELNENAENRIREQFSLQLESQNQTIADYQEKINTLKIQLEEALDFAEAYKADLQAAQDNTEEAEKNQKQIEGDFAKFKEDKETQLIDKDNIIAMLTEKMLRAEDKAKGYDDLEAQNASLKLSLTDAQQTIKDNLKDAQIEQERAVREAEKAVESENRKEIERLRSQNTELLQNAANNEREFNKQFRTIEKENFNLKKTVSELRMQLQVPKN